MQHFDFTKNIFTAPAERKTNFVKTDVEESTITVEAEVVNTTVESIINDASVSGGVEKLRENDPNDEEISQKTDAADDVVKCLSIDMHSTSSSSATAPDDDSAEISRKNEQVDNIILNTSVQRDIKDTEETAVVVVASVTSATTTTADEQQPEKTIQESADVDVEIAEISRKNEQINNIISVEEPEPEVKMNSDEEKQEIIEDEPALPKSSGYNLDFLDKLDDPNFNPFETKVKVQNFDPESPLPAASVSGGGGDEKLREIDDPNFNPFETKSKVSNDAEISRNKNEQVDNNIVSKPTAIVKPQSEMKQKKVENIPEEKKKEIVEVEDKQPKEVEAKKSDEKPKKKPLPPKPWLKKKKKLPSNSDDTSKTEDSVSGKLLTKKNNTC